MPADSPDETAARAREVLQLALQTPLPAAGDIRRADTPAWDSLKHVELIFMLEDEFGLRLDEDQMQQLSSLGDIVRLASARP